MQGGKYKVLLLGLLLSSCGSPRIQVRTAGAAPVSPNVADAEGQLALGNVALAMEGFRKAAREQPQDIRALAGIAQCYDLMGRFDLSRKWYETALAIAPNDPALLGRLAASLDMQGLRTEAASVRAEAAAIANPVATQTAVNAVQSVGQQVVLSAPGSSVTVALPPPLPAGAVENVPVAQTAADEDSQKQPRLERLSLGEVALITTSEPVWTSVMVKRSPQSVTFRFIENKPVTRLLNAARWEGLAAATRERLLKQGWTNVAIGDAPATRDKTLVLYPSSQRSRAVRLATELGFGRIQPSIAGQITVLLGRDATPPDRRAA